MFYDILVDVILLGLFLGGAYYGYKKGLFRLAVEPFRALTCFFVAFSFSDHAAEGIITPVIAPAVRNYLLEFCQRTSLGNDIYKLPFMMRVAVAIFDSPALDEIGGTFGAEELVNRLSDPIVSLASGLIAFVLLFLLARLISRLILNLIYCFLEDGILGRVNSVMGVILSGFIGLVFACLTASLIDYALHLDAFSDFVALSGFQGGAIYSILRKFNLIRLIFGL